MSTRVSLFYNNDDGFSHFFRDMADDVFHIEKEQKAIVDISLKLEELISIAKSVNLQEIYRQANLSDDEIKHFVTIEYNKSKSCSGLFEMWVCNIFGDKDMPQEDRIQKGIIYYTKLRDNIRQSLKNSESYKTDKILYGLESFK
jgi:hypothetical protein